ncbi:MAG: hypothetical protein ACI959_001485, partial [Limisphaerales bacterium]
MAEFNRIKLCLQGIIVLIIGFGLIANPLIVSAQGTQESFGQNRVQYKLFEWQYYESDHFITYFNAGGQSLGRFASQMAETDLKEIEELLDYRVNRQIDVVVYNTIGDFNQTNIGASAAQTYNPGGQTQIISNKLFVYFNGSHSDMRRQIREGIGRILISNMIFGGNLQEIVQNAVLLNLPEWFVEGLVAYIGEEWNADLDDQLRDGMLSGRYEKFNKLTGEDARFAGHSLWYFIAERNGVNNIPNLLYLIRVNRSLENGFLFVLGNSVSKTVEDWQAYYLKKYEQEIAERQSPDEASKVEKKFRKRFDYHSAKLSPDGNFLAYVTDDAGRFKVRLKDLNKEGKKTKRVKKGGIHTINLITDDSYPVMAWDKHSKKLAIVFERRGRTQLVVYNTEEGTREESEMPRFQRIQSINFTNDSRKVVISALNKGQSDIYLYYITNGRLEQITNDFFDDLDPTWVNLKGDEGIIFASNREEDTIVGMQLDSLLPVGNLDLYFYNYSERKKKLLQLTHTPHAEERQPAQLDDLHFSYLSDASGIRNRYAGYLDSIYSRTNVTVFYADSVAFSPKYDLTPFQAAGLIDSVWNEKIYIDTAIVFPLTNFARNINEQSIASKPGKVVDVFKIDGKVEFFIHDLPRNLTEGGGAELIETGFRRYANSRTNLEEEETIEEEEAVEADFFFQTEFPDVVLNVTKLDKPDDAHPGEPGGISRENVLARGLNFKKSGVRPYKIKYATESVTTQLDNSLFLNKYQSFTAGAGSFIQPSLNGLINVSAADLFEDYRFIGGFRIPTSFSGSEYFITYQDNHKRLDWRLLYYYQSNRRQYGFDEALNLPVPSGQYFFPLTAKLRTNIATASAIWPFDVVRSLRGYATYRNEKIQFLSTDIFALDIPNAKDDWLSFKIEYVHDNTKEIMTNLPLGMRWKAYYEMHKGFEVNVGDGFNLSFDDGFLGVVGLDFRHYQRIHRNFIWANRFATAASFGQSKLIYYLGGVDSWLGAEFDPTT